ncbi:NAD(P)H-dependent flavin oxidoreductase [Hydrogenophaga sp. OTU3427]|uniref:NAD(P)H-dependent flavin oxidoreductase n=1 Tax=Hydrogenophaga sp. OTU3427 TaxID=3043856 RepID=UPI00313DA299
MTLPAHITRRLRLPLIAAPMLRVSGPELVIAACRSGVVGAFPTLNARDASGLDDWIVRIVAELKDGPRPAAPWCPNLIMHREPAALRADVACLVRHGVEMVITSVGSPAPVVEPLHDAGCLVFADVATIKHARKAIDAGADGLILLTAGAGGQTGWLNGFAFVRAVRAFFDGPVVLAGGVGDGASLLAAQVLGCDLAYMGTGFIATQESMAPDAYRQMLVDASADDVVLTRALNGIPASLLAPSLRAAGLDPATLDESITPEKARELFSQVKGGNRPARWKDVWSAGHSVSAVSAINTTAALVERIEREYLNARRQFAAGGA